MRIVLPFSFIYFYTVKNGRFLIRGVKRNAIN